MAVDVERQLICNARPEQLRESRIVNDLLCPAFTTDMAVEADHTIGLRHHDVQVVAYKKHAASKFVADFGDQMIKCRLARNVDTGEGFVKNEKLWLSGNRAREQYAREFTAGERRHLPCAQARNIHARKCAGDKFFRSKQPHETPDGDGQAAIARKALRHVTDRAGPDLRVIVPVAGARPRSAFRRLVFPDPFGPIRVTISPAPI